MQCALLSIQAASRMNSTKVRFHRIGHRTTIGDSMDINGIAAVVTGAASGLGEATARELARRGAKVAVFDRDAQKGEHVAGEIGGIYCEVDVTDNDKVAAAFGKAREAHGQERVLINCAGVANAAKTVGRD